MAKLYCLNSEIELLKGQLKTAAKTCLYDFNNPKVIGISQDLDQLIVQIMKEKHSS